jgi:hypothetical protein
MRGRFARNILLLTAPVLLQGCVAAVIPAIAASSIVKSQAGKKKPKPSRELVTPGARAMLGQPGAQLLPLKALPPPTAPSVDPTLRFVNYALMAAAAGKNPAHSMVLSPEARVEKADFLPCDASQPMAVAIDAALASSPSMFEALRRLRAFSVEVLWIADAAEVDPLRAALTKSGAWAHGDAPILTTGVGAERKELVRQEATRAFCVVAVAAAKRSDVEELYAYLRDPITAAPLESYWDAGWFVLPATGMGN